MSAHVSVSEERDYARNTIHLTTKKPAILIFPTTDNNDHTLAGILGVVIVATILGTGLYLVIQYLL